MSVEVGNRIVVHGHKRGEPSRDCVILEVCGSDGGAPYLVRWGDDGHESLFFPGDDATVHMPERTVRKTAQVMESAGVKGGPT